MKISVITACLNNAGTIEQCIRSVASQTYDDIEHFIVDGASTDGTVEIINKHISNTPLTPLGIESYRLDRGEGWRNRRITKSVSEPDEGLYHALNKGVRLASGDVVGFLHADDFYADDRVVETVAKHMNEQRVESCYGDLVYVSRNNEAKTVRYWKSSFYKSGMFQKGWMPPHPTFYVKRDIYSKYGLFNTDFKIAADYELMLRFLERHGITTCYIPRVLVKMRTGGNSNRSLKNIVNKTMEDYRAMKMNNIGNGFYALLLKNISKVPQFIVRREKRERM